MSENYGAIYWYDKPLDPAYSDGTMLTGVRIIRKPEAVDIMNKQHDRIAELESKLKSESAEIDKLVNRLQSCEDDNHMLRKALEQIIASTCIYDCNGDFYVGIREDAKITSAAKECFKALEATKPAE